MLSTGGLDEEEEEDDEEEEEDGVVVVVVDDDGAAALLLPNPNQDILLYISYIIICFVDKATK